MEGPLTEFQTINLFSHKRSPGCHVGQQGLVEPIKVRRVGSATSVHDLGRSLHRLALPNSDTHDDTHMDDAGARPPHSPEGAALTHHPSSIGIPAPVAEETVGSEHCDAPSGAEPSAVFAGQAVEEEEVDREPGLPQDMEGFDAGPGPSALFSSEFVSGSRSGREEPAAWLWHGGADGGRMMGDAPPSGAASLCEPEGTHSHGSLSLAQEEGGCARLARGGGSAALGACGGVGGARDAGSSRKRNASQAHEAARAAWEAAEGARAMARLIVQRCAGPPPLHPLSRLGPANAWGHVTERDCSVDMGMMDGEGEGGRSCLGMEHVSDTSTCMPEAGEYEGVATLGGGMEDE